MSVPLPSQFTYRTVDAGGVAINTTVAGSLLILAAFVAAQLGG
jgi:hypothetical protein